MKQTHNVYFGVNLLSIPRRKKENAIPQAVLWADLDTCKPSQVEVPPQLVIESSEGRYHGVWFLQETLDPLVAENLSKRIAYKYHNLGADLSGWDLTQILRVPTTYNWKYDPPQEVILTALLPTKLPVEVFSNLPAVESEPDEYEPIPDDLPNVEQVIYRYKDELKDTMFMRYYTEEPHTDWSKALWWLINTCVDVGMTTEEAFVIAKTSKCNKYARDGRPDAHLWRDVQKAELNFKLTKLRTGEAKDLKMPQLLEPLEQQQLEPTIIDEYVNWASEATDAPIVFHELSSMILLSTLTSTSLRMDTSNNSIVPNLWGLLLGDSSLTRKTTAMNLALNFIYDIEKELVLAGDASPEGLLANLALRPKMVSMFHRDEVTGFFSAIKSKEYLASMPEIMTKMYDVPQYMPRTLRKETFVVSEPIFIFFGGGVPDKMYELIQEEYYLSGFIPRFLMVEARHDIDRIRPTGPPTVTQDVRREELLETFYALHHIYSQQEVIIDMGNGQQMRTTPDIKVLFTDEMWNRCADVEMLMMNVAKESYDSNKALPTFSRLFVSILKMTMLLAAARQDPKDNVVQAEMKDLQTALHYGEKWGKHIVHFVRNSGMGSAESKIHIIYKHIEENPGVMRGLIMNRFKLTKRDMDIVEETLEGRLQIDVKAHGKGRKYWPTGG